MGGRLTLSEIFEATRDPALTPEEKVLWTLYRSYEGSEGSGAFPGDERLARHMGLSERSVQGYRARLLEKGYLRRKLRGPRPALFWAVTPDEASKPTTKLGPESFEADREAKAEASKPTAKLGKASQEASQEVSQCASPEYGKSTGRVEEREQHPLFETANGNGRGRVATGGESGSDAPVDRLHAIYLEVLGGSGRPTRLTDTRREKYRAWWSEYAADLDDPEGTFRALCEAVRASDFHMSKRAFHRPESVLENPERRERWTHEALDPTSGLSEANRRLMRRRREMVAERNGGPP